MTQVLKLPTQSAVWELPHWAQVAFAARCARRLIPLFREDWPDAPADLASLLWEQITLAEIAAATGRQAESNRAHRMLLCFGWQEEMAGHRVARGIVRVASCAALAATKECGEAHGFVMDMLTEIQNTAEEAFEDLESYFVLQRQLAGELTQLLVRTEAEEWTDETRVPPDVFDVSVCETLSSAQADPVESVSVLQRQFVVESCKLGIALLQSAQQPALPPSEAKPATADTQPVTSRTRRLLKPLAQLIAWLAKTFS